MFLNTFSSRLRIARSLYISLGIIVVDARKQREKERERERERESTASDGAYLIAIAIDFPYQLYRNGAGIRDESVIPAGAVTRSRR
jgi:mRNA degradation ribonuclease J1/J2